MNTPASRQVCSLLKCRVPVVCAGMGGPARSELVSAVTAAGGFGYLGMVREPVDLIRREVEAVRARGHGHFGVNLIPASTPPALLEQQIKACIELRVPVVGMFWDLAPDAVAILKAAGIIVTWQVGSVDEALAAERLGVDLLIVQGREAGGHVRGTQRLGVLLPEIVQAVHLPVLAAGGLSSGADLVTALALGAGGVALGTAFLATDESYAHRYHKERLLQASAADTILTDTFHINWPPGAPVRVIKSDVTARSAEVAEHEVIGHDEGRPIIRFSTDSPLRSTTGELGEMALYAGTGVGSLRSIVPAGERLRLIVEEAEAMLETEQEADQGASPVCYLKEQDNEPLPLSQQMVTKVNQIASLLQHVLRWHLRQRPDTLATGEVPFDGTAHHYGKWALLLGGSVVPASGQAADQSGQAELESELLGMLTQVLAELPASQLRQQLEQLHRLVSDRVSLGRL